MHLGSPAIAHITQITRNLAEQKLVKRYRSRRLHRSPTRGRIPVLRRGALVRPRLRAFIRAHRAGTSL